MPLRDHFHPPLDNETSWNGFYAAWPTVIVMALHQKLPPRYVALPRFHFGSSTEIDASAFERDEPLPRPTLTILADLPAQDEYEVRVHDTKRGRRLVAAVEIVSPANKERPEHRTAFVAKCLALLQQQVSVTIVDLVTTRRFNLYGDLLKQIGQTDPALAPEPPHTYAVACRSTKKDHAWQLEAWLHPLVLGQPLPTLPLWLADDFAVPLELEPTYEETCRILRIA